MKFRLAASGDDIECRLPAWEYASQMTIVDLKNRVGAVLSEKQKCYVPPSLIHLFISDSGKIDRCSSSSIENKNLHKSGDNNRIVSENYETEKKIIIEGEEEEGRQSSQSNEKEERSSSALATTTSDSRKNERSSSALAVTSRNENLLASHSQRTSSLPSDFLDHTAEEDFIPIENNTEAGVARLLQDVFEEKHYGNYRLYLIIQMKTPQDFQLVDDVSEGKSTFPELLAEKLECDKIDVTECLEILYCCGPSGMEKFRNKDDESILHIIFGIQWSYLTNQAEFVLKVLEYNFDGYFSVELINSLDRYGRSILHVSLEYAAESVNLKLLEKIDLFTAETINSKTQYGASILHESLKCAAESVNLKLLEKIDLFTAETINSIDKSGNSILHMSLCHAAESVNLKLLEKIDLFTAETINSKNQYGYSILHMSLRNAAESVNLKLLEKIDLFTEETINSKDVDGDSILYVSVKKRVDRDSIPSVTFALLERAEFHPEIFIPFSIHNTIRHLAIQKNIVQNSQMR